MINLKKIKYNNFINYYDMFNYKISIIFMVMLLSFSIVSISQARIIVDINVENNQQPTLVENDNAETIINIQAANTEGISHNKYTQFNVDAKGVILNNFISALPNSRSIASPLDNGTGNNISIGSNELLRESGAAHIILNEVTSLTVPSQLNGSIAVAGQKANIIIANPAGIECNGCGFINTRIANLSAASPLLTNGSVQFLTDAINEKITFSGNGLSKEANQSDYTTLIANKININAPIHANKVLYAKLVGDKNSMHTASLNISEFGGIYADKIFIGNIDGNIGVHNNGEIKASAELELNISGLLDSPGVIKSEKYFHIKSENFNTTLDSGDENSMIDITNNMLTIENPMGFKSEKKSILQKNYSKLHLLEVNKIDKLNSLYESQIDTLKNKFIPAYIRYLSVIKDFVDTSKRGHFMSEFRLASDFKLKKDDFMSVREQYKNEITRLDSTVSEFKKSFANSDYSHYKNMNDEEITKVMVNNGYMQGVIFRLSLN